MRIFCAWCREREWVDGRWVKRREEGGEHSHGLCFTCAQRLGRTAADAAEHQPSVTSGRMTAPAGTESR